MDGKRKLDFYSKQENNLIFTKFRPPPAINQKNYYTDYLKRDSQLLVNREEHPPPLGTKTVVIAPGSRNLRIGILGDQVKDVKGDASVETSDPPIQVPMCVARPRISPKTSKKVSTLLDKEFEEGRKRLNKDFTDRMNFYHTEIPEDALSEETSFNSVQKPQTAIEDKTWQQENTVVCSLDVDPAKYEVFWPIQNGTLNENYKSVQELYGDLTAILTHAVNKLGVPKDAPDYAAVLVIPDLYEQAVVSTLLELLVTFTRFGKIAVVQEAVATTFAIGLSSACVVSVGAQSTSITCVDDGMSILDSRVNLKYGGDDITALFGKMISTAKFPVDFDLNDHVDFDTLDNLKQQVCTTSNDAMAVNLGSFVYSRPSGAEKYEFKLYKEVMVPILGFFYPQLVFDPPSTKLNGKYRLIPRAENVYDGRYDDPIGDAQLNILYNTLSVNNQEYTTEVQLPEEESRQETPMPDAKDKEKEKEKPVVAAQQIQQAAAEQISVVDTKHVPLDHAIIQSIKSGSEKTGATFKQFYENILIIGGGAQFSGFDQLLTDRLGMWTHKDSSLGDPTITALGEITPDYAAWRGACVYASLPIMKEMWIESKDWETLGSRLLQYKALFAF